MPSAMRSLAAVLLLAGAALPPARAAGAGLDALRDRARPVLILSERRDDPRAARQRAALDADPAGARERAIVVMSEEDGAGVLHRRFGLHGFAVVLVGKDGGVKSVWREPVEARRIFAAIDAMPMRRQEMGRREETAR